MQGEETFRNSLNVTLFYGYVLNRFQSKCEGFYFFRKHLEEERSTS